MRGVRRMLKILSLSTVYPNRVEPTRGLFVRARLQALAAEADLKVMAPVRVGDHRKLASARRRDGEVDVLHPGWFYIPGTGAPTAFALFAQLLGPVRTLCREFPFQVLDAHFGYPDGIAAALLSSVLGVPFTVTLRGSELLHGRYPLRRRLMGWAFRRASCVFAVSDQLRGFAVTLGAEPARARTIPNGVDSTVFHPRDRLSMRRRHGLPLDGRIVMTAGHLIELKGHHRAVAALRILRDHAVSAKLLIVGGHPGRGVQDWEPQIRQTISELGVEEDVRLTGPLPPEQFAEVISAVDVFCLASSREGWPNVLHEALACGIPVAATDVGAVRQLVPSEEYGLVVRPNDPAALAAAIQEALERQWDRDAIVAWAKSRSWSRVATEVLEQMQQVIVEAEARSTEACRSRRGVLHGEG